MTRGVLARTLAAAALACGTPGIARAADRPAVRVAVIRAADAVPFFYAVKAGLFEKAGIDVTYDAMASGGAIAAAIAGKATDIGFSNVQTLILAHERKVPFTIVAGGGEFVEGRSTTALVVGGESAIKSAKDLEGAVVAVGALQDMQALSVLAWMTQNGADPSKVRFIESPASAAPALLAQKRADAIVVSEPNLQYAQANGARLLATPYAAIAKRFLVTAWFSTSDWAKANPVAAMRFGEAMRAASEYANAHVEEMNPLINAYSKIPLDVLKKMAHARQAGTFTAADVQAVIDAGAKFKVIQAPFNAKELIDRP